MVCVVVVNARNYDGPGEYIGRSGAHPSILANDWSHLPYSKARYRTATRDEAIDSYAKWLNNELKKEEGPVYNEIIRLAKVYADTGTLTLICHCKPKACHGDILAEVIKEKAKEIQRERTERAFKNAT